MSIRPDMIGLVVRDLEASLRFYRHLGFEVPTPKPGEDFVETTRNGYRFSWNTVAMIRSLHPDWVEPVGQRIELAFRCDAPAEVDATCAALAAAGYAIHKAPWDAFWGQRYAIVVDPDDNHVSLFAPL